MTDSPSIDDALAGLGLGVDEAPALRRAAAYSQGQIELARTRLAKIGTVPGVAAFAFGSLGRDEASICSDLDLAFLWDGDRTDEIQADRVREACLELLGGEFEVPQKTFCEPIDVHSLLSNIGGRDDTNVALTYRALLLTEGVWLFQADQAEAFKRAIFGVYASGAKTRGRYLTSLLNDLQRYYRTLCVDYRFKIEEGEKQWATRILKLRHQRKLWHLANLLLSCSVAQGDSDGEGADHLLEARLGWPPIIRVAKIAVEFEIGSVAKPLVLGFDRYLERLSQPAMREELDGLGYEMRNDSSTWRELHSQASEFDLAAAAVVEALWPRCRDHFVRFCLL